MYYMNLPIVPDSTPVLDIDPSVLSISAIMDTMQFVWFDIYCLIDQLYIIGSPELVLTLMQGFDQILHKNTWPGYKRF